MNELQQLVQAYIAAGENHQLRTQIMARMNAIASTAEINAAFDGAHTPETEYDWGPLAERMKQNPLVQATRGLANSPIGRGAAHLLGPGLRAAGGALGRLLEPGTEEINGRPVVQMGGGGDELLGTSLRRNVGGLLPDDFSPGTQRGLDMLGDVFENTVNTLAGTGAVGEFVDGPVSAAAAPLRIGRKGASWLRLSEEAPQTLLQKAKGGGFTVNPSTGEDVVSGIVVAANKGDGSAIRNAANLTEAELEKEIMDFFAWNSAVLDGRGVGGWMNGDDLILDIVDVYPPNSHGLRAATRQAHELDQDALWHLDDGREIQTYTGKRGTPERQPVDTSDDPLATAKTFTHLSPKADEIDTLERAQAGSGPAAGRENVPGRKKAVNLYEGEHTPHPNLRGMPSLKLDDPDLAIAPPARQQQALRQAQAETGILGNTDPDLLNRMEEILEEEGWVGIQQGTNTRVFGTDIPIPGRGRLGRAEAQGYDLTPEGRIYHGTDADVPAFSPSLGSPGVHTGTPAQANDRLRDIAEMDAFKAQKDNLPYSPRDYPEGANIMPLVSRTGQNPDRILNMTDVGAFDDPRIFLDALEEQHPRVWEAIGGSRFADEVYDTYEKAIGAKDSGGGLILDAVKRRYNKEIADRLIKNDLEEIRYLNTAEGPGAGPPGAGLVPGARQDFLAALRETGNDYDHPEVRQILSDPNNWEKGATSRIVLDPSNLRSPHAQFDPAKLGENDLLGGITAEGIQTMAGGMTGGLLGASQVDWENDGLAEIMAKVGGAGLLGAAAPRAMNKMATDDWGFVVGPGAQKPKLSDPTYGMFNPNAPKIQGTKLDLPAEYAPTPKPNAKRKEWLDALVDSPEVQAAYDDAVRRGQTLLNKKEWYETGGLVEFVTEMGGDPDEVLRRWHSAGAAASSQNSVANEFATSSAALYALTKGLADPGVTPQVAARIAREASAKLTGQQKPAMMTGHWEKINGVFNPGGTLVPGDLTSSAWKTPSYSLARQGFGGDDLLSTLDKHELKFGFLMGMADPKIRALMTGPQGLTTAQLKAGVLPMNNANDYQTISRLYSEGAQRMGMPTTAAYQAPRWVGGGRLTGLDTDPTRTYLELLADQTLYTAQMRGLGESPHELRGLLWDVLQGNEVFLPWYKKGGRAEVPLRGVVR